MAQIVVYLNAIFALMPEVIKLVQAAEQLLPQNGQGAAKLALVQSWLQTAMTQAQGLEVTFEQVWPLFESTISKMVAAYNAMGLFVRTAAPSAAPSA